MCRLFYWVKLTISSKYLYQIRKFMEWHSWRAGRWVDPIAGLIASWPKTNTKTCSWIRPLITIKSHKLKKVSRWENIFKFHFQNMLLIQLYCWHEKNLTFISGNILMRSCLWEEWWWEHNQWEARPLFYPAASESPDQQISQWENSRKNHEKSRTNEKPDHCSARQLLSHLINRLANEKKVDK
jgi:hypothetical protein